ncbi:MAG: hypothetical protein R3358_08010 [Woeseiaceae bacterium]|nr:hypothetical protein [Woeseiaceae bacterium]
MIKLQKVLSVIGAIYLLWLLYSLLWPLAQPTGITAEGAYRDLRIGAPKAEVALMVASAGPFDGDLKVTGYLDPESGQFVSVVYGGSKFSLIDSNTWFLAYPGIHRERIEVVFENDLVVSIRYTRSTFDP